MNDVAPPGATRLAWITGAIALAGSLYSIYYALAHYASMPARIPVHFGFSGQPDRWANRSAISVLFLPLLTLFLGVFVAGIALLTAHATRAIRHPDDGASLAAQQRFRTTMTRFLCGLGVYLTVLLTTLSIAATRVAAGKTPALPLLVNLLIVGLVVYAIGGALYIALRLAPEDPSIFVEKRFGVGYTLNLGNRKAVVIAVGLLMLIAAISLAAFLAAS